MRLTLDQLRGVASGAAWLHEDADGVWFHRFTPAQEDVVLSRRDGQYRPKLLSTAGVCLRFRTDSERLRLAVNTASPLPGRRTFFAVDVCVDGRYAGSLDNLSGRALPDRYGDTFRPPLTAVRGEFVLGPGEKAVKICLPWSLPAAVAALELDDGASVIPDLAEKSALFFGDSITQGYDALHPRLSYASRLSDALGVRQLNKAIGGDFIFPRLAAERDEGDFAAVVIAYGTNDWGILDAGQYERKYVRFLDALAANYPGVPVFALTPLTRLDTQKPHKMGPFSTMEETIRRVARGRDSVRVIDCGGFFPPELALYSDGYLHPSDAGMKLYAEKLYEQIAPALEGRRG